MSRLHYDGPLTDNHRAARERATADRDFRAWIDGTSVDAGSGRTTAVTDPADGESITDVPACGPADVDAAVKAAEEASPTGGGRLDRANERPP